MKLEQIFQPDRSKSLVKAAGNLGNTLPATIFSSAEDNFLVPFLVSLSERPKSVQTKPYSRGGSILSHAMFVCDRAPLSLLLYAREEFAEMGLGYV